MKISAKLIRAAIHEAGMTMQAIAQNDDQTVEDQFDSLPEELQRWIIDAPIARFPVLLEQQNARNVASNKEVTEAIEQLVIAREAVGTDRVREPAADVKPALSLVE